jgi:hypothetical protein
MIDLLRLTGLKRRLPSAVLPLLLLALTLLGGCSSSQSSTTGNGKQFPVANGDFETGVLPPWLTYQSVQASVDSAVVHGGRFSLTEARAKGSVYQDIQGLKGGAGYTVSAWVCGSAGTTARAQIAVWDPGTNASSSSTSTLAGPAWQLVKLGFTASSSRTIRVHLFRDDGNGDLHWDDVRISQRE